jgi:hypothetical protein
MNLDSSIKDGILLTKLGLMFLTSKLEVPTLNKIWSFLLLATSKKWVKSLQNFNFNFDRRKTLRKLTITFNSRIVDRHIEFPYCMLLFDKSNKQPAKLEAAVTWSKSNLNIINICEEKYHQFLDMCAISVYHHYRYEFEHRSGEAYSIQHYVKWVVSDL